MTADIYISFVAYVCAVTFLPGPNNILLFSAVGQTGFRKCLSLLFGIWTGLFSVMLIAGFFCSKLNELIPQAAPVLKYIGAAYILYLSFITLRRKPSAPGETERKLNFAEGFLLQFLNVKVIMLGLASFPGYFMPYGSNLSLIILFAATMTVCCGAGNLIWAFFGSIINPFYDKHYRSVNIIMALLLLYCALKVIM